MLGPVIGIPIALAAMVGLFLEAEGKNIPVFLGIIGGWLLVGVCYYVVWGRKRVIESAEEVFGGFLIDVRKRYVRKCNPAYSRTHAYN